MLLATNAQRLMRLTGVFAGCLVALYITFEAPLSGMSMNPARTLASALPGRLFDALWIYFVGPAAGMLLAVEAYRLIRRTPDVVCAKLNHHTHRRCIFRCGYAKAEAGRRRPTDASGEPPMSSERYDVIVVGSGAGGAAAAYRLARAGRRVLMLEKGRQLPRDGSTLDTRQVFKEGKFKNKEPWLDGRGGHLVPDEHYNVGGKTKWYGAALLRFSAHEFEADPEHQCLAWPFGLEEIEPYYDEAERLLHVNRFDNEPRAPGADRQDRPQRLRLALRAAAARAEARDPAGRAGGEALRRLRLGRRLQGGCRAQPDRRHRASAQLHPAHQEEGDRAPAPSRARPRRSRAWSAATAATTGPTGSSWRPAR